MSKTAAADQSKAVTAESITEAEWEVMRIVWTLGQTNAGKIIEQLQIKHHWSESTIKTLMRRLVNKGMLATQRDGHRFLYSATCSQAQTMLQVTDSLFNRMCDMHKGGLLIDLIKTTPLAKKDILALIDELEKRVETAPASVPCDCLADGKKDQC
ncbi:CopY/TcrY family copper transport repressor [Lactobacillus corticis]|nr:CopY/TcrY family copper transport repressor [Lactobacillus corticis]